MSRAPLVPRCNRSLPVTSRWVQVRHACPSYDRPGDRLGLVTRGGFLTEPDRSQQRRNAAAFLVATVSGSRCCQSEEENGLHEDGVMRKLRGPCVPTMAVVGT